MLAFYDKLTLTVCMHGVFTILRHGPCPYAQVFDLKQPVQIPYHNYQKALKMLQQEEHVDIDHNHWKETGWQARERAGRQTWGEASHKYYV